MYKNSESIGLRRNALTLSETVVMGVAGSAPAYSLAATTATLIATTGDSAPACLLYCSILMFGIVISYRHMNREMVNSGAGYTWVSESISPLLGFLSGWALLVAAVVFMVSGTLPAAAATVRLFSPGSEESQLIVTLTAALWLVMVALVVAKGIKPSSYFQMLLTFLEVGIILALIVFGLFEGLTASDQRPNPSSLVGAELSPSIFASGALIALFAFSGWDVTANLNEETDGAKTTTGRAAICAMSIVTAIFVGFNYVTLTLLDKSQVGTAGLEIVGTLARTVFSGPLAIVGVIAVMLSTIGTLETSFLQFTRTLYSMGRDRSVSRRFAQLNQNNQSPVQAVWLITALGLTLLIGSLLIPNLGTIVQDSVNAIGLQVAFYYILTGISCAWYFRKRALSSVSVLVLYVLWPLVGAAACLFIAAFSVPTLDAVTVLVATGAVALGLFPYFWNRRRRA